MRRYSMTPSEKLLNQTLMGKSKSSISGYCCSQSFCLSVVEKGGWVGVREGGREGGKGQARTYLVEHEELGVALVQVVLLPAHFDVHVVDGVPVCVCGMG